MLRRIRFMGGVALLLSSVGCTILGASLGTGMALLPEGMGIQRLSSPLGDRDHRIVWTPPHYAILGERPGLGAVGQGVHWLDGSYKRLSNVSWSSDGQRIALVVQTGPTAEGSSSSSDNVTAIYVNEPGTFDFKALVSDVRDGAAFVSPNGKFLIVADSTSLGVYRYTLHELQNKTSKPLALGDDTRTTSSRVFWSADSERVARLMSKHQLLVADLKSGEAHRFESVATEGVGWSPDGKKFFAYDSANGSQIFVQPIEGGAASSISLRLHQDARGNPSDLMLSPDGQTVAFTLRGLRPEGVYVSDLNGGMARQVAPPSRFVGWMPGGTSMICLVNADNQEVSYSVNLSER